MTFELASESKNNCHRIDMLNGGYALVNPDTYEKYHTYPWYKVRFNKTWYAKAVIKNGRRHDTVFLHRLVAKTPRGMVCHHDDRNGLNCLRSNLSNETKSYHHHLHMTDRVRIKFEDQKPPVV